MTQVVTEKCIRAPGIGHSHYLYRQIRYVHGKGTGNENNIKIKSSFDLET